MIRDAGHEAADAALRDIERRVAEVYGKAQRAAERKFSAYSNGFLARDEQKRALVDDGKLSKKEYLRWRKNQILVKKRYREMADSIAKDLTNADKIAVSIVNGHLPDVYAVNANYGTYQIEKFGRIDTSWTLYDRHTVERLIRDDPTLLPKPRQDIPKDLRWNKTHINNEITTGVLNGEPIKDIAKRLRRVTTMDMTAAMRNARTAVTGAQNAGRVAAYKRAEDMGIEVKKEWLSAHDGHTRQSHLEIDGEQVGIDERFSNGLEYPGDPSGAPEEVYNCRCTMIPALKSLGQIRHKESFDEWMAEHEE